MWLSLGGCRVGNRMCRDFDGVPGPSNTRSLSMGDVLVIGERAYTALSVGWTPVDTGDLLRSLDPAQATPNPRLVEAYRR